MVQASNGHVLIVDDDASIKRMFQLLLKDAGYRVSTASSSDEVLQFLKVLTPDVILLDISLPGMDGVELTRKIKSDPEQPFIPIILVTALGDMKTKVAGLDAGADDFLVKPVEFSELLARLRVMIRLQQSRRSLNDTKRRIETLLRVSQTLTTTLDVETLLQRMILQLSDSLGAVRGSIILVNGGATPFYASASKEVPSADVIAESLRAGVAGWVIRARRSLLLSDARRDSRWNTFGRHQDSTRSVLATPILQDNDVLGVITLVHSSIGYFQDTHRELLESIAAQSGLALRHARLFLLTSAQKIQLERRSQLLEEILNVSERMRLNLPLSAILDEIAEAIYRSLGFNGVLIRLFHANVHEEAQGVAGREGMALAKEVAFETMETEVFPLLRIQFHVSRSYFVPAAQFAYNDDFSTPPSTLWQPDDRLYVPIGSLPDPLGLLVLSHPNDGMVPDLATVQALEIFADQVFNAIQNRQLFAQERARSDQLQMLVEVGSSLTELMTVDQLLRLVTSLIQHTFGFWSVAVLLLDTDTIVLRAAAQSAATSAPVGTAFPMVGPLARVAKHRQTVRSDTAETLCLSYSWLQEPVQSELAVPISLRNNVLGVLVVASDHAYAFDEVTESLLTALASQITVALENARLFTQEQAQVQQLNRVNALSGRLNAGLALDDQLIDVVRDVAAIFSAQQAALLVAQADQQSAFIATLNTPHPTLTAATVTELANLLPTVRWLEGPGDDPAFTKLLKQLNLEEAIVAALPSARQMTGLLALTPNAQQRWTSSDRNLVQTVANLLGQALENTLLEHERKQRLRDDMSRYMAPQLVDLLLDEGGFGAIAEKDVVVLFADLRGFTALTEGLDPRIVVEQVLNRFFTEMTHVLYEHEATIDKFLGDGVMAVFGSVRSRSDDVPRAVEAAIAMQIAFQRVQETWTRELGRTVGLGIGMSFGRAVVGNLGSPQRLDYTLIGDVVNTASRLADIAESGQIIVAHQMIEQLPLEQHQAFTPLPAVSLKGKSERLRIYEAQYSLQETF